MCPAGWNVINVGQIKIGALCWNLFLHVWLNICRQVSPWLSYIFDFVRFVGASISKSQRLRAGIPSMRKTCIERNNFSFCTTVKQKSVSCTTNLLARTFGFRKCTEFLLMLTLSLQNLLQNQSPETILICIVVQCFPHDNIVDSHSLDECRKSHEPSVCYNLLSILWSHAQVCSQSPNTSQI